ncbi:hypothetical protein ACPV5A_14355 [Vibrio chagasii]|uniref:hypothetical protein n=1 Tax=Vibrio chagasii TaxID=170679 RepID=UPI004067CC1A
MSEPTDNSSKQPSYAFVVPIYIFIYTIAAIWLLIGGWVNNFSVISGLWGTNITLPPHVQSLFFTMIGALLGCSILGITSFHRYVAIEKSFDRDHLWGFLLAPLLAVVVGLLIFALLQSGLVVLTNQATSSTLNTPSVTATFGYLAIGGVAGYNWDVFVKKLQELSANVMNTGKNSEKTETPTDGSASTTSTNTDIAKVETKPLSS